MVIISHGSSEELWRSYRRLADIPARSFVNLGAIRCDPHASTLCSLLGLKEPFHVLVYGESSHARSGRVKAHCSVASYAVGSFCKIEMNLFVCSPELTLVQLARDKSRIEMMLLLYEFCGRYRLDPTQPDGLAKAFPLTSERKLRAYVEANSGIHGSKKLRGILPYVLDGSASPMESKVALLLCLPTCDGGYGIKLPELNYRTELSNGVKKDGAWRGEYRECDLYWPEERVALEYNSDAHHADDDAKARDSIKQSELGIKGVTIIPLSKKQVYDARELDLVARMVAKALGVRLRIRSKNWMTKRYELRKELGLCY